VSGISTPLTVGDVAQLVAIVTLAGAQKDATAVVSWRSSNPAVATIDPHGHLTAVGVGECDVAATYQSVAGTAPVVVHSKPGPVEPTYSISGVVHESAPTANVVLADARVEVVNGGPLNGQLFSTDAAGRFSLPAVSEPGFAIKFKRRGYEDVQFDVVQLPRDQHPDIALNPDQTTIREIWTGTLSSSCLGPNGFAAQSMTFPVHHEAPILFEQYVAPRTASDPGGSGVALYAGDQLVNAASNPLGYPWCPTCLFGSLHAGVLYRLTLGASLCTDPNALGFRVVFTHPN
jgi:Big-like domain-containing protein